MITVSPLGGNPYAPSCKSSLQRTRSENITASVLTPMLKVFRTGCSFPRFLCQWTATFSKQASYGVKLMTPISDPEISTPWISGSSTISGSCSPARSWALSWNSDIDLGSEWRHVGVVRVYQDLSQNATNKCKHILGPIQILDREVKTWCIGKGLA